MTSLDSLDWPVQRIRDSFFSHFETWRYTRLSPDPLISVDDSKPFVDTYLNQFTREVNGTVRIDSRKNSYYSLKCIRLGSDGGLIDKYRMDSSYHCFTEVLGCWASGDHNESVRLSWELLTQRYKLPRDKIYITYFAGNKELCIDPDMESFNMWKKYLKEEKILPSTSKADFWRAGDIGPCGPSVRILFDLADSKTNPISDANVNDDRFVEIWRFVFVQYNMHQDAVVRPLDVRHVIGGMNVETMACILQKKTSHYDSDVFSDILGVIQYGAGEGVAKYSGKVGNDDISEVDAAYRLVADHLRTVSASTSYYAQHGLEAENREALLKHGDRQAMLFGHKILDTKLDRYAVVVSTALRRSGFYPVQIQEKIESIVKNEVQIYQKIQTKDDEGYVDCSSAMIDSNLRASLPQRKKEKKKKMNQRGKQQQKERPPKLPLASDENEDHMLDEIQQQEMPPKLHSASDENEDLDEIDGRVTNIGRPEMEISRSHKSVTSVHSTGVVYPMRQIDFNFLGHSHSTYIIYQDKSGPCPLISICNCLLLKGKINFESDLIEVSMERLVHVIQDLVKERLKIKVCYSFAEGPILDVVTTLAEGLDIDVKFNRTDGFTATPGTMLFDCLEIPLYHGWLSDEEDMAGALSHSFETLTWAVREPHFPNVETLKKFLNGPQLTAYGLVCLHEDANENVPSVHYWNNHFSTIIKYHGALYTLVTDAGYLETNVVWQTLNNINGSGSYMSSDFTPIELELGATTSGGGEILAPLGSVAEIYFKSASKRHVMPLKKFISEHGNEFSVKKTLFPAGTPLDVVDTTRTGRIMALDILRSIISAHSTGHSYNGACGLSSIYVLHDCSARICAPFCGKCTDATKSKDFETYITDILEIFRIGEVLPAYFTHLINLLRNPGPFIHPRYFWDCVLTTLALKPPLSRAGLFQGIHRIRRLASKEVRSNLRTVLQQSPHLTDWREHIFSHGHPLLRKVLLNVLDKSLEDKGDQGDEGDGKKKYGLFKRNLYSLSIFPRQVNEHGKPKVVEGEEQGGKVEGSTQVKEGEEQRGIVEVKEEGEEPGGKVEGSTQLKEGEEPFELLSDLDLLYSHHLDLSLPIVLESLLNSPDMTTELWEWVKEVLHEYDKPEAMNPAPWDRSS